MLDAVGAIAAARPSLPILADSRRSLRDYPSVGLKMNRAELALLLGVDELDDLEAVRSAAAELARRDGRPVIVTLAEQGLLGAEPEGRLFHFEALPRRGEIDIVGAGDSVTANLTTALAAGATLAESLQLANVAASIVIHQLGTTGAATVAEIEQVLRELLETWLNGKVVLHQGPPREEDAC